MMAAEKSSLIASLVCLSPAKLNLFFRVLRKRPDGYHDISSLFQAIDLFDRLFFSLSAQDELTCSDPSIPCDGTNLVSKAIAQFRKHADVPPVKIHIEKHIPIQAGLGGGSSNAATTLWALNELIGKPFTQTQLIEIGATIGSDVPFFFSSGTAHCTGRGEILEPFTLPEPLRGYLAKPTYGLSTPLVYKHTVISELPVRDPQPRFFNDLEIPSFRLEPRLAELRNELRKSFGEVVMTGSGTAFFCLKGVPVPIDGVTFVPFRSILRTDTGSWY
jgi:4-diphosphocytidyl-2-C-methyl-D-erythritol kinase